MVITVTGSTGSIGSELMQLLAAAAAPARGVFRDVRKIRPLPGVVWVHADLSDVRIVEPVLAGTTRLFVLSDNHAGFGKLQISLIRAAAELGVEHIVKLSALGASAHSSSGIAREHWEVEQVLQQLPLSWTILRPHAFMQNWLGDVAATVRAEDTIYAPIADGRVPFIDTRDIAAVAATALLDPATHAGRKYFLTGGEAVGYAEVAAAISAATGRSVKYQPISLEEARARLESQGTPAPLIDATLAIAAYQRAGGPTATVSDKVERVLGRAPRTIRDFARDYASHFQP